MFFSKFTSNNNALFITRFKQLCTKSSKPESYYDILKLPKNCSSKDIRDAYLKLSKQYHPDKNKDDNSHKHFLKISEAYNVLSNRFSRYQYDISLSSSGHNNYRHVRTPFRSAGPGPWDDPSFWVNRDRSKDKYNESKPYYGIQGLKKVSNKKIAVLCIGLALVGVILQILAIRAFASRRDEMRNRSVELEKLHNNIRANAIEHGNAEKLELYREKLIREQKR